MLRAVVDDETCLVATMDNLVFLVWRAAPTIEGVEAASRALTSAHSATGANDSSLAWVTIIDEVVGNQAPQGAVRDRISEVLKQHQKSLACSAIVYEGSGFRAAIVRSVVAFIEMGARGPFARGVFAKDSEAIPFVARELRKHGVVMQPSRVQGAFAAARRSRAA